MLRLFKKLFKSKTRVPLSKPIIVNQQLIKPVIERQIFVSKSKKVSISPTVAKRIIHEGGNINEVINTLVRKINKLHQKQKKYGLNKTEKAALAEYRAHLERVASTREGAKRIFVED